MTIESKSPTVLGKPESNEWPALIGRIIGDFTRIVHTEIRLFQASLNPIFSTAVDRLIGNALALVGFVIGGLCLLIALVLFLHKWMGWDAAFAVTGAVSLIAGYICSSVATIRADRSIADLERKFAPNVSDESPR